MSASRVEKKGNLPYDFSFDDDDLGFKGTQSTMVISANDVSFGQLLSD